MKQDENPQAFPLAFMSSNGLGSAVMNVAPGMTLLDYFAARVMETYLNNYDSSTLAEAQHIARESYRIAHVMIQERAKVFSKELNHHFEP